MTKRKSTKSALFTSTLALFLCFTMLLGTTYAWFTDSVTSAGNIIQTGNLNVEMYWADGDEDPATLTWNKVEGQAIFNNDKWEPGYVEAKHIKIANEGNLALKWRLRIVPNGEVEALADVIDVYYVEGATQLTRETLKNATPVCTLRDLINDVDGAAHGALLPSGKTATNDYERVGEVTATLAFKMRENASNDYQGKKIGTDFSLQLLATQYTYEADSFDKDYDKDAQYDESTTVKNEEDFLNAVSEGKDIKLENNIDFNGDITVIDKSLTINLNGFTLSSNRNYKDSNESTTATLHIKGADTKVVICGDGAVINNYQGNLEDVDLTKSSPNTFAIYVSDGADLTIMDGTYKSFGSTVYIGNGSVNIQGGFFESDSSVESEPWYKRTYQGTEYIQFLANVVNCSKGGYIDGECTVEINGGTFVNEDPSDLAEGWELDISHVVDGYKVVSEKQENGDVWYTVVAE